MVRRPIVAALGAFTLVAALIVSMQQHLHAAPASPSGPASISSASADLNTGRVTIVGANFGTSAPIVVLDGFVRPLVAFGPSRIIAVLPNSALNNPGSYSLLMVPTT